MPQFIVVILLSLMLTACGGPPVVGSLSEKDLCRAVEEHLRKQLDMFVISEGQECAVKVDPDSRVEVASLYKSPLGSKHPFVARGHVAQDQLVLAEIQVEGVSEGFVPFDQLGK